MLELLITNPHVHLALAVAFSVAAAYFWGHVIGHRKGMHDERVRFLSFLFSEKMEELTKEQTDHNNG